MTSSERSLKILVTEDDLLIAELLSDMLTGMGHDVCGIEATEAGTVVSARRHKPDLLIVDLQLNPGSGVAAVDLILKTQFIPHIFVSGNIARLVELRPDAIHLAKPYTQTSLSQAISDVVEIHHNVA